MGFATLRWRLGIYGLATQSDSILSSEWQPLLPGNHGPLAESVPLATTSWLDPGVGAFLGAAGFLGGCSRIPLMTTVMMVEITGDPAMIAPAAFVTLVAIIVANRWNHGLYHSLIDVASFPFMPDRWPRTMPKGLRVEDILRDDPVHSVSLTASRRDVEELLRESQAIGFPVLDEAEQVAGYAMRVHLHKVIRGGVSASQVAAADEVVDIGSVTDFHHVTIRASMPLEVAYNLFKHMELSQVVIVDDAHRPVAMLDRSALLPWKVEDTIGEDHLRRFRQSIHRPARFRSVS